MNELKQRIEEIKDRVRIIEFSNSDLREITFSITDMSYDEMCEYAKEIERTVTYSESNKRMCLLMSFSKAYIFIYSKECSVDISPKF